MQTSFKAKVLTVETTLTAEHLRLRTELLTYNDELQAKLLSVGLAQQNSYAALQIIAADTATELKSVRELTMNLNSVTNDANAKVAAKFYEMDEALEKLKSHAKPQDQANQEPANSQMLQPDPRPPFIDPVSGKCEWADSQHQAVPPDFGPSDGQRRRDDGLNNWCT